MECYATFGEECWVNKGVTKISLSNRPLLRRKLDAGSKRSFLFRKGLKPLAWGTSPSPKGGNRCNVNTKGGKHLQKGRIVLNGSLSRFALRAERFPRQSDKKSVFN